MRRTAELRIDHIGFCAVDYKKMLDMFDGLGFHMGDFNKEGYVIGQTLNERGFIKSSHYYMGQKSAYIELLPLNTDGTVHAYTSAGNTVPFNPQGIPGIYNIVLSARDADGMKKTLSENGFKLGETARAVRKTGYYETIGGSQARCSAHFERGTEPFPHMFFAIMAHLTDYFTYHPRTFMREYHPNGYETISSLYLYYEQPETLMSALKLIHLTDSLCAPFYDDKAYSDRLVMLDAKGYEEEFLSKPPSMLSNVCAVEFRGGDLDYVRRGAEAMGIKSFRKDGKIYLDCVEAAGVFLIFGA
jgi:hypothetical protein